MAGKSKTTKKSLYDSNEDDLDTTEEQENPSFNPGSGDDESLEDDDMLSPASPYPYKDDDDESSEESN